VRADWLCEPGGCTPFVCSKPSRGCRRQCARRNRPARFQNQTWMYIVQQSPGVAPFRPRARREHMGRGSASNLEARSTEVGNLMLSQVTAAHRRLSGLTSWLEELNNHAADISPCQNPAVNSPYESPRWLPTRFGAGDQPGLVAGRSYCPGWHVPVSR
jgi:hypothetical protein